MHKLKRRPLAVAIASLLSGYLFAGNAATGGTPQPGFVISPSTGLSTTETNGNEQFEVSLTSPPATGTVVEAFSLDSSEVFMLSSPMSFDAGNWNVPQTVSMVGLNDNFSDGDVTVMVRVQASGDAIYDGIETTVEVVNLDNDPPAGLRLMPASGLTTAEPNVPASFTVALTGRPEQQVNVSVLSLDSTEGVVGSGAYLEFDSSNWSIAQAVAVSGADDPSDDGDIDYNVEVRTRSHSAAFHDLASNVALVNLDDEAIIVTPLSIVTTEQGNTATFSIVLGSAPLVAVNVAVQSLDFSEGIAAPHDFAFEVNNWNIPRVVTVMGADDLDDDGDVPYVVRVRSTAMGQLAYHGKEINVAVINLDDETTQTTTLIVETSPSPSRTIEPVTVRVALSEPVPGDDGLPPSGILYVSADTLESCEIVLPADSCVLPPLTTLGARTLGAQYAGDGAHLASSAQATHSVVRRADLAIVTQSSPALLIPGMALDYVTVVSNAGPDAAPGTRVENAVPDGLLGASWTCMPLNGGDCGVSSGSGDIDQIVDMEPGVALIYTMSGTVATPEPETMTNLVTVTPLAGDPGYVIDPDAADHSDSEIDIGYTVFNNGFEDVNRLNAIKHVHLDSHPAGTDTIDPLQGFPAAEHGLWTLVEWQNTGHALLRLDARQIGTTLYARLASRGGDGLWRFGAWTALPAESWQLRWWQGTAPGEFKVELRAGTAVLQM
jgi:hypothetical protein